MGSLDIKTIILSNILTDLVCTVLILFLWLNNKEHFKGLFFWLLDYILQTLAISMLFLRGVVPDWITMILSNSLTILAALFGYIGLQQYCGKTIKQTSNYLLLSIFILIQTYFSIIEPNGWARNLNITIVLLIIYLQCSYYLFLQSDRFKKKPLVWIGSVFAGFSLLCLSRIIILLNQSAGSPTLINTYAWFLAIYQILLIVLVFALTLSVNSRLLADVHTNEDKFTKTFHFSPVPFILTQLNNGIILEVNSGFEAATGFLRNEIIGKTTLDIGLWSDSSDRLWVVNQIQKEKQIINNEFRFRKNDGEFMVGLFAADLLLIDNMYCILASIVDISERKKEEEYQKRLLEKVERDRKALFSILEDKKRTQDSLYESESRYRSLFEATNVAKSITYPDGSINVNQAFCKWLGYSIEEMNKMNWRVITPEDEYERIDRILKSMGTEVMSTRFEKKYLHKDGSIRWGDVSTAVQVDNKGEIKYYITTIVDITEKKAAEEAINKLNAELEKRVSERTAQLEITNKELEAFSYSVSHDLRAPLRHITGYVDLLNERTGKDLSEQQRHYMSIISDSAKQMGILIDDLLQFSRMGRKEIHSADLNMNALINEIIDEFRNDTQGREMEWAISKLPNINADHAMIRQVWRNLIENAVKFTRKKPKAKIIIGAYNEDGKVVYYISDNGAGFDMKYAQKLFGVFQRMHRQDEFEGTGIGLANVQRIISKHEGRVWAESESGKGSTFYFSLPVTN